MILSQWINLRAAACGTRMFPHVHLPAPKMSVVILSPYKRGEYGISHPWPPRSQRDATRELLSVEGGYLIRHVLVSWYGQCIWQVCSGLPFCPIIGVSGFSTLAYFRCTTDWRVPITLNFVLLDTVTQQLAPLVASPLQRSLSMWRQWDLRVTTHGIEGR
jgi:hypothetical protein